VYMVLAQLDWWILGLFFLIVLGIGWWSMRSAGKSSEEFFLGGRNMPWWLLGISMVATTFSADTPNLVTGLVREGGVSKNWAWWAFLVTGMITVFVYSRLWRRSNVITDLALYEMRYAGKAASFLRGFRALYLGVLFNCLIMGTVTLAAIKIGAVMFGLPPWQTVVATSVIVVIYSTIGGIKGVIWTDFFQFMIAMVGAFYAAYVAVSHPSIGSFSSLLSHPNVSDKLALIPDFSNPSILISMFIIPLAVQWWSVWYPGSEPGGGGYIAQRMLAAKNENHAIGATLLFNAAHYALRPWPWIIVALASLVIFPDLDAIREAFPSVSEQYIGDDLAYPVMMTLLGPGWLGLVVASLIAAFMSTISTHLNWGSSYIVNDFYARFVKADASEKEKVLVGRISTILLMVIAGTFALTFLENATQAFNILILSGAGTGGIFLLRWFWWRINAVAEITAMVSGIIVAMVLVLFVPDEAVTFTYLDAFAAKLVLATIVTSCTWVFAMYITPPESFETLKSFYKQTSPGGPGWKWLHKESASRGVDIYEEAQWDLPRNLLMVFTGTVTIYATLFATGQFIYGNWISALWLTLLTVVGGFSTHRVWLHSEKLHS
jgi:SSS family solute:Na+ symporter